MQIVVTGNYSTTIKVTVLNNKSEAVLRFYYCTTSFCVVSFPSSLVTLIK